MSMSNDISWGSKDNEQECELSAQLVSVNARRLSDILLTNANHKENGTELRSKW